MELLILILLLPECWEDGCAPPLLASYTPGVKPKASWCSTNSGSAELHPQLQALQVLKSGMCDKLCSWGQWVLHTRPDDPFKLENYLMFRMWSASVSTLYTPTGDVLCWVD